VLDLVGLRLPRDLPGRSLVPRMRGEVLEEAPALIELADGGPQVALATARHTLLRIADGQLVLWDREVDPGETRDHAAEQPQVVAELAGELERRLGMAAGREREEP
jgi:hypothetical protein